MSHIIQELHYSRLSLVRWLFPTNDVILARSDMFFAWLASI